MPIRLINGVRIEVESSGTGVPIVLVHGSWGDHHNWDAVVPALSRAFQVITYDRRGHSQSERLPGPGSVRDDVADLAAIIAERPDARAHVVGSSFGGTIVLTLAAERPDLFATLTVHEPPLVALLGNDPGVRAVQEQIGAVVGTLRSGHPEAGAQQFVETVALGPGMWEQLPPQMRQTFVYNAPTWLDEVSEPGAFALDLSQLSTFGAPALLTQGDQSPPFFGKILDQIANALPHVRRHVFAGSGHVPHLTDPGAFVQVQSAFIGEATAVR